MSLGNLPTEGNKKNNYPYQWNVVDLLNKIKTALVTGTITVVGTFTASSTQRTPTRDLVTTSGTVPAGFRKLTLETSDDFVGTILGAVAYPSRAYSDFQAQQNNDTVGAVTYTITSGSIILNKLT